MNNGVAAEATMFASSAEGWELGFTTSVIVWNGAWMTFLRSLTSVFPLRSSQSKSTELNG